MNMVRTTVRIREDLYQNLMRMAVARRITLSEALNAKLANKNFALSSEVVEAKLEESRNILGMIAKKTGKVNWANVVRRERDNRTNQLASRIDANG